MSDTGPESRFVVSLYESLPRFFKTSIQNVRHQPYLKFWDIIMGASLFLSFIGAIFLAIKYVLDSIQLNIETIIAITGSSGLLVLLPLAGILMAIAGIIEFTVGDDNLFTAPNIYGSILVNIVKTLSGLALLFILAQFLLDSYINPLIIFGMFLLIAGILSLGFSLFMSGIFATYQEVNRLIDQWYE